MQAAREIAVIVVPYDSGRRAYRMGAGPERLVGEGLANALAGDGSTVNLMTIDMPEGDGSIDSAIAMAGLIAAEVRNARERDAFPLVLAGNCISTLGAVAAAGANGTGVVWFDAHGDVNTPDTSPSGFVDGMAAAVMLGWCHATSASTLDGFTPLQEKNLVLIGARDLDSGETDALARSSVTVMSAERARNADELTNALRGLAARVNHVHIHLDLDVLDAADAGPANTFASTGGLSVDETAHILREIRAHARVSSMTISAYDPTVDPDGSVAGAAIRLILEGTL